MISLLPPAPRATLPCRRRDAVWRSTWRGLSVRVPAALVPRNPERRRRCENSLMAFAMEYFPEIFRDPSVCHEDLVRELQAMAFAESVLQLAFAAPRGIGKSTVAIIAIVWAGLYRHRLFLVIIATNAELAEQRLAAIKNHLLRNDRLFEDFPEIVSPIREFGGEPRSASANYPWRGSIIKLMNGVWITARGIDGSLLGLLVENRRPDFVLIDDPEDEDTVRSKAETELREARIRKEILFLGELGGRCSYLLLCTIRRRDCICDRFTDPKREPEWSSRRYSALVTQPERMDLWDEFMDHCRDNQTPRAVDDECVRAMLGVSEEYYEKEFLNRKEKLGYRAALDLYCARKDEMDVGAEVLDEKRIPLHAYFRTLALKGEDTVASELQNQPKASENSTSTQLDLDYLIHRLSADIPQGVVPEWAAGIFCAVDVGVHRLHWETSAFSGDGATSVLVDQGIQETDVNVGGRWQLTDAKEARRLLASDGIRGALHALRERFSEGWPSAKGGRMLPNLIGVDCGGAVDGWAWYDVILLYCQQSGPKWLALKGEAWSESIADRALGRHWIMEQRNNPGRRIDCDVNIYKKLLAAAYERPSHDQQGLPLRGARLLHHSTPKEYLRHQTAEKYYEEFVPGKDPSKSHRIGWILENRRPNHWFDTAWMTYALADIWAAVRPAPARPQALQRKPVQVPPALRRERF